MTNFLIGLAVIAVIVAVVLLRKKPATPPAPSIPFAPVGEDEVDLDALERQFPLSVEQRLSLDQDNIKGFTQPQVDQIYARISAGSIPEVAWSWSRTSR